MDAPVEQQPLVKATQAAELARRRARVDAVLAQVLEKRRHILLRRGQQDAVPALEKFGKGFQIAVVRLAGQWPQPFFHAQIRLIILQERQIALCVHTFDYLRPRVPSGGLAPVTEPRSSLNQHHQ